MKGVSKAENTVGSERKELAERLGACGGRGDRENVRVQGWVESCEMLSSGHTVAVAHRSQQLWFPAQYRGS